MRNFFKRNRTLLIILVIAVVGISAFLYVRGANADPASQFQTSTVERGSLTATIGAQCMSWVTSPAATELEQVVMDWLRQMAGLPAGFVGSIQDTASTATLVALGMDDGGAPGK